MQSLKADASTLITQLTAALAREDARTATIAACPVEAPVAEAGTTAAEGCAGGGSKRGKSESALKAELRKRCA